MVRRINLRRSIDVFYLLKYSDRLFMIAHALCTAVLPYLLYTVSLGYMDAGKAAILCSCEPVAAMVFGVIFFGEVPTVLATIGLVIVIAALAMLAAAGQRVREA